MVTLSTTEVEYLALGEAIKEAIGTKGFICEFGVFWGIVNILCDSQSAIQLTKHPMFHERCKHIDVRKYFIRGIVNKGFVKVINAGTEDNAADMLIIEVLSLKFTCCLKMAGVETT